MSASGPVVAQIEEEGIERRIEAAVPSSPFPVAPSPPAAPLPVSPAAITFQYVYEGLISPSVEGLTPSTNLINPQVTAHVTNATGNTGPDQFDFSLVTYSDTAKFNLARLDSTGVSGIRNVAVEGDVLTKVTAVASSFFAPDSAPAGVDLPQDQLAGVAIRDYAPQHFITAKSIQAVAFGSTTRNGQPETGAMASASDAANLLAVGTAIVQAGSVNPSTVETFRVPFADVPAQQAGFFLDDTPGTGHFDSNNIALVVQNLSTANSSGTANNITQSNEARGAVIALITVAETTAHKATQGSIIESISLRGDGGSIATKQTIGILPNGSQTTAPFTPSITSTGALGDVIIQGALPNVTAPSIFGSILPSGPIPATSTIQTTGIWTNPITSATSQVPADLGRLYVAGSPQAPVLTVTQVQSNGGGLAGQILVGGNLISQVVSNGPTTGVITVQPVAWEPGAGNLGVAFTASSSPGPATNFGGFISNGPLSAPTVSVGASSGTTNVTGLEQGGIITVYGSVIGNIVVNGPMNGPTISDGGSSSAPAGAALPIGASAGKTVSVNAKGGTTSPGGSGGDVINLDGTLQGGSITTYGSVIGNISINGPMNGPTLSGSNSGTAINVNGLVQGGFITTYGSVAGNITIGGPMNGPALSANGLGSVITVNALVAGGSITTGGSATGAISVNGPVNGPTQSAPKGGGTIKVNVPLKGGSILTGGTLGNLTIGGPLGGQVVTIGNMNGTVTINGPIQNGVLATSGAINGGVVVGGPLTNGQILSAGNINGNVTIKGPLQNGRIATLGSIVGSMTIAGSIDSQSAVVAGGSIGGPKAKFVVGAVNGILAAVGPITGTIGSTAGAVYYKPNDTLDAAVIDAIFTQGVSPLSVTDTFDRASLLDLENLSVILVDLNSLTVKNGKLVL